MEKNQARLRFPAVDRRLIASRADTGSGSRAIDRVGGWARRKVTRLHAGCRSGETEAFSISCLFAHCLCKLREDTASAGRMLVGQCVITTSPGLDPASCCIRQALADRRMFKLDRTSTHLVGIFSTPSSLLGYNHAQPGTTTLPYKELPYK